MNMKERTVEMIINQVISEIHYGRIKKLKNAGAPNIVIENERKLAEMDKSERKINGLARKHKELRLANVERYAAYETQSKVWGKGWKNTVAIRLNLENGEIYYYDYQNNKFGLKKEFEFKNYY